MYHKPGHRHSPKILQTKPTKNAYEKKQNAIKTHQSMRVYFNSRPIINQIKCFYHNLKRNRKKKD